jgi:hypothetical protein
MILYNAESMDKVSFLMQRIHAQQQERTGTQKIHAVTLPHRLWIPETEQPHRGKSKSS